MSEEFWTKARSSSSLGNSWVRLCSCISTSQGLGILIAIPYAYGKPGSHRCSTPNHWRKSFHLLKDRPSAIDAPFIGGQTYNYLDNATSTFWTTQMPTLLLIDDEPKLIFKQVSHVFAPRGFQIELV